MQPETGPESESGAAAPPRIGCRAIAGFAAYVLLSSALLFVAAGTIHWPAGWVYVLSALAVTLGSRLIALRVHPDMLRERARFTQGEGVPAWDRWLAPLVGLAGPVAMVIVAGLDHRFGWSPPLPPALPWIGLALLVLGYGLTTWAFVANRFFAAGVRIQAERGHTVVDAGPYRWVRHPGYAGGIVAFVGVPLLLGTLWAYLPAGLTVAAVVVRTALEDKLLRQDLPGYAEYARRVRYRLLPGVW
jgi:protein-S-isoprenylcysteine O-methyltransferase Ste14